MMGNFIADKSLTAGLITNHTFTSELGTELAGGARPLSEADLANVCEQLGTKTAEIWAILDVETAGCGFLPDRRPQMLFERHKFSAATGNRFDDEHPDVSNPKQGGYGAAGAHQYERLVEAIVLDERAALRSASWGIAQILGSNAGEAGFTDVRQMVSAMVESEANQLIAAANWLRHHGLDAALRAHDWETFGRGYNGPDFKQNRYDERLRAAFAQFSILLPDLTIRASQILLTFNGFHPGRIDGVMGARTRAALEQFQHDEALVITGNADPATLEKLAIRTRSIRG